MYKEESRRRIKQHQLQKESEVAGCTFQPKITEKGKASAAPAVKKRFDLLYESKRESLEQLEEKRIAHELSGCTFKVCNPHVYILLSCNLLLCNALSQPTVNKRRSLSVPKSRPGCQQVHERLHNFGKENKSKIERLKDEKEKKSLENCTFSPAVNKQRNDRLGQSKSRESPWERLHRPCTKEDMMARLERSVQDPNCTFRPKIIRRSSSAGRQRPTARNVAGSVFDR